jgi:hypothetical protein
LCPRSHGAPPTFALAVERVEWKILETCGETAEPVTRWSVNATTAIVKARVRHNDGKSSSYLVVRPRDTDRTPLGQDGIARPLRHARIRCEGSCGVLRQAPSENEALGFAVRRLHWGHALQEMSGAPTVNSSRDQIPPQLHWSGVDKIGHVSASDQAWQRPGG